MIYNLNRRSDSAMCCLLNTLKNYFLYILLILVSNVSHAEETVLNIFQSTDIHARVGLNPQENKGDWLKIASLIKQERKRLGLENCLLIDCGDTLQGSFIGAYSKGKVAAQLLDILGYDAWVIGNHDLEFGAKRLDQLSRSIKTPIINGNLQLTGAKAPFSPYRIYHRANAKVVIIGMNASFLDNWLWGKKWTGCTVRKAVDVLERIMPELMKQKPDMIILALHQAWRYHDPRGMSEVNHIAKLFPQIDLILGGHTHQEAPGKKIHNSWYVQAGQHAQYLSKIVVTIDTQKHRVIQIKSQLLPVAKATQDPETRRAIKAWLSDSKRLSQNSICQVPSTIHSRGTPGIDCEISELICRAIAWSSKAEVVFHGKHSSAWWRGNSTLTEAQLFHTIPYENSIGVAWLTPTEIQSILEEQLSYLKSSHFNGLYGLIAHIDKRSRTVKKLTLADGRPLVPNKRIMVAFNSYVIASAGARFKRLRQIVRQAQSNLKDMELGTRDVLRKYLKENPNWYKKCRPWLILE